MGNNSTILLWESHEQYEKVKDITLEDENPGSASVQYSSGEEWRNSARERARPKQKWRSVVDKSGGESKVQCCKEQYCIGTWNVRSRNQGKLDIMMQETARVNINIWGISELKCMGMGKFNSDGHYIYYCGQESLKRNGVTHTETKRSKMQDLDAISKMTQWSWFISKANHSTLH